MFQKGDKDNAGEEEQVVASERDIPQDLSDVVFEGDYFTKVADAVFGEQRPYRSQCFNYPMVIDGFSVSCSTCLTNTSDYRVRVSGGGTEDSLLFLPGLEGLEYHVTHEHPELGQLSLDQVRDFVFKTQVSQADLVRMSKGHGPLMAIRKVQRVKYLQSISEEYLTVIRGNECEFVAICCPECGQNGSYRKSRKARFFTASKGWRATCARYSTAPTGSSLTGCSPTVTHDDCVRRRPSTR